MGCAPQFTPPQAHPALEAPETHSSPESTSTPPLRHTYNTSVSPGFPLAKRKVWFTDTESQSYCAAAAGGRQEGCKHRLPGFMVSQKCTLVPPFLGVREGETGKCSLLCKDEFSHERFLTFRVILRQVRLSSAQTGKPLIYPRRFQVRWTLRYRS